MNTEKKKQNCRLLYIWSLVFVSLGVLLVFPKEVRNGGSNGGYLCIQVLIPSLFPFTVLSDFAVRSKVTSAIPKPAEHLTRFLFALPKEALAVILLTLTGGYPVGAKVIRILFERGIISEDEAKRMSLFSVASGPGFLVTYLGSVMLGSLRTGYILLLSQILSVLILGICTRFMRKNKEETRHKKSPPEIPLGDCLVISVFESVRTMASMCGLVILFSAVAEVYLRLISSAEMLKPLAAFLEITTGCKILAESPSPILIAFFTGFGGLCVHLQIFAILRGITPEKSLFFIFRFLEGILCALFTFLFTRILPQTKAVFSSVECVYTESEAGMAGCFLLIVSSGIFLLTIGKKLPQYGINHRLRR